MSFLKEYKHFIIAAFNRKVLFIDGENCWSYQINSDLPMEKCRPRKYFDADSDSDENDDEPKLKNVENQLKQKTKQIGNDFGQWQIVSIEVSEAKKLLAVATSDKSLFLFEISSEKTTEKLKFLSRRMVSRTSSCMRFSASGEYLIVCDKGGDCYRYDCGDSKTPGRWLMGHMSQVLDVIITDDEKFIITCDRDEKIRITNHPDCHSIETFCLGHAEFVSQLAFVKEGDKSFLLSLSGDKTLRVWDYSTGKELAKIEIDHPGSRFVTKHLHSGCIIVAILFYEPTKLSLYKLYTDTLKCCTIQSFSLEKEEVFSSLTFDEKSNLDTLVINKSTGKVSLKVYQFDNDHCTFTVDSSNTMLKTLAENTESDSLGFVDSVSFLFKKKFDNIKDYQERKRRRMEESSKIKA